MANRGAQILGAVVMGGIFAPSPTQNGERGRRREKVHRRRGGDAGGHRVLQQGRSGLGAGRRPPSRAQRWVLFSAAKGCGSSARLQALEYACFFSNGAGASGVVLRNEKGEAVAGADDLLDNLLDAPTTEARALLKGLQLIEDLGCRPVVVESDSLQIVEAFNGVIDIWSSYAAILIDCFHTARRIGQVKVQHCPREANVVAHKIARHAFDLNSDLFWDRIPPSFIMSYVLNDVSLFDWQQVFYALFSLSVYLRGLEGF